jgi:uncharacterized protein involved in response to NO
METPTETLERHVTTLRSPTAEEIFTLARGREMALSRLLMAYTTTGLFFMLFPGTMLGVWNLMQISGRESVGLVSPAWLQAHGHAQVFGWIGSFLLGIGFYSIPKLRGTATRAIRAAWVCWALWTMGVAVRWVSTVYLWDWRVLVQVSSILELAAFLIFLAVVSQHRPQGSGKGRVEPWVWVVMSATLGFLSVVAVNLAASFYVAFRGVGPAFPHRFDQRYLALMGWGFLVPFVWGFSAKWMRVFLGLRPLRPSVVLAAVLVNATGVILALAGNASLATWLFVTGAALAIAAIRMFERSEQQAKTKGVHRTFPFFVRVAYAWLIVAALLGVAAVRWDMSGGIWGASRHALTVGFVAVMVLSVGQRILPAFAGMRLLWSEKLMFVGLLLLTIGCTLRVSCEVLAYQGYAGWAWSVLPASALIELAGLTVFAINILGTFVLQPSHAQPQPVVIGTTELRIGNTGH